MIYIFDELDKLDEEFLQNCDKQLSSQRRDKIKKHKTVKSKIQSAVVYLLLRQALSSEFGIDEAVEFVYNKNGKPQLKDYPHIHFCLSHCKTAAACVLSDNEVGVDVQHITPVSQSLAKRVLTEDKFLEFQTSQAPDEYFCRVWTIKESFLKLSGKGIAGILSGIDSKDITDITLFRGKDYFCCSTGKDIETYIHCSEAQG